MGAQNVGMLFYDISAIRSIDAIKLLFTACTIIGENNEPLFSYTYALVSPKRNANMISGGVICKTANIIALTPAEKTNGRVCLKYLNSTPRKNSSSDMGIKNATISLK